MDNDEIVLAMTDIEEFHRISSNNKITKLWQNLTHKLPGRLRVEAENKGFYLQKRDKDGIAIYYKIMINQPSFELSSYIHQHLFGQTSLLCLKE